MVTAQEASALASQEQRALNSSRFIPNTPEIFREASRAHRVYIFNVGPWAHVRELGSAGSFRIPACPENAEYSDPLVIDGVVDEPYPINEAECKIIQTAGSALAGQIIGVGPHVPPNASWVPFGVFVSPTPKPSKAMLVEANAHLQKQHLKFIREADAAFFRDPTNKDGVIQPAWHFVSANILKKTSAECRWLGQSVAPAGRDNCPGCGEIYNKGILRHSCGWFFDKAKWEANQGGK